jgi:hypothetical protein
MSGPQQQGGQSDHTARKATSYVTQITVHQQNHLGTLTQFVDSKSSTPTAIAASRCPDNHCRNLRRPSEAVSWPLLMNSLPQNRITISNI